MDIKEIIKNAIDRLRSNGAPSQDFMDGMLVISVEEAADILHEAALEIMGAEAKK